ncbi:hypothetical protein NDU88_001671 [Pleurodeles waltl]|uniref:Uncharacterized protein n=1 Tax=Pleurodeles waltl TaxID=8319 RepID=A0AAV7NEY6_PLEWA|nr:hypothetical protein NDU88_001671 [Pleurodeles waltl]
MPAGKAAGKHTCQLLFSEAISFPRLMASPAALVVPSSTAPSAEARSDTAMERILQEITAVGCRLEAMDLKITDLSMASNSIRSGIASFKGKVTNLDHRLLDVEGQLAILLERDSELQFLCANLMDLKDRSQRDNVSFLGIPEHKESTDVRANLRELLPELTGLISSPILEFQRAHRISPPIKLTQEGPTPSSHASYATNKRTRLLLLPEHTVRTLVRGMKSMWPQTSHVNPIRNGKRFLPSDQN